MSIAAVTFGSVTLARAQETAPEGAGGERQPLAQAERPLTLPHRTLAPEAGLVFQNTHVQLAGIGTSNQFDFGTTLGVGYGIIDDLEVHGDVAPIRWTHTVTYGSELVPGLPEVGATYRFLRGMFEMGAELDFEFGFVNDENVVRFAVDPGVPMRLHIGKTMRLDAGVFVPITVERENPLSDKTKPYVGISIPVSYLIDIIEPLHVAIGTGFASRFDDFGHDSSIPLGFEVGWAVKGPQGPILDIDPFFRWPALFLPGAPEGIDKVQAGLFRFGVNVRGYLYL